MPNEKKESEKFTISQKAILIRDGKCLIVEIANRPGFWELPGGRLDKGEKKEESLRREIKEELGFENFDILGTVDYDVWYWGEDNKGMCGTTNLIKNNSDEIVLSSENFQYKWIDENQIGEYNFFWPTTPRMIKNGFKYHQLLK